MGLSRHLHLLADDPMAAPMQRRYYLKVQSFAQSPCVARKHVARRGSRSAHGGAAEQLSRNTFIKIITELGIEDISPCPGENRSTQVHPAASVSPDLAGHCFGDRRITKVWCAPTSPI